MEECIDQDGAGVSLTFQPYLGAGLGEQGLHQHFCPYGSSERLAGDSQGSSTHPAQCKYMQYMNTKKYCPHCNQNRQNCRKNMFY